MPPNTFFPQTRDLLVNQKMTQRHFLSTLHPLSVVIFATATWWHLYCFAILGSTSIVIHSMKQCILRNWPGSGSCDLSRLLVQKITKGIHSCKPASLNRPIGNKYWIQSKTATHIVCDGATLDIIKNVV